MRITKEMVEGMGGTSCPSFDRFQNICLQAYSALRRSAPLLLTLLRLMSDGGIQDLSARSNLSTDEVLAEVESKLQLGLSDVDADVHMTWVIRQSVNARAPAIMDIFHDAAQAARNFTVQRRLS
jgi:phosphatidylinositol 3-kinase